MIPARPTWPAPSSTASRWPAPGEGDPPIPLPRLDGWQPAALAQAPARPRPAAPVQPSAQPGGAQPGGAHPGGAHPGGGHSGAVRAVIGDLLRRPALYCQSGACITRYSDPAALGERDVRDRAVAAGWRHDALGRIVCPGCQQRYPFWATRPLARRGQARRG